ncbi:MAG: hypothetical protein WEC84_04360 [Candidatus Andersenbacteria bacterium]
MSEKNVGGEPQQLSSSPEFAGPPPPPMRKLEVVDSKETALPSEVTRIPVAQVSIRTMKDDITGSAAVATPISTNGVQKPLRKGSNKVDQVAAPKTLPLLPKPAPTAAGVKQPEEKQKKGIGKKLVVSFGILTLLVALGAGGWYAWLSFIAPAISEDPAASLSTAEIIPKDAVAVIRYSFAEPTARAAVRQMWGGNATTATPLADAARGNPALLAETDSISEVLYVLLPNNTRPFMLIPRTDGAEQLFATQSSVQVSTLGNWIIAHPINSEIYKEILSLGTWAETQSVPAFAPGLYIQLLARDATLLVNSDESRIFSDTTFFTANPVAVQGRYDANARGILFTSGADLIAGSSTTLKDELLPLVPAEATFARLGTNFAADLTSIQSDVLDTDVLQQPQVQQLISSLTGPYAYYRTGQTQQDLGLIVSLPAANTGAVEVGDVALESSLRALIPVLSGVSSSQVPQLAFASGEYQSVPLRYVNLANDGTAIDYAVVNGYLLVASSKDVMFGLIDVVTQSGSSLAAAPSWQPLITQGTGVLFGGPTALGSVNSSSLATLLPIEGSGSYSIAVTALESSTRGTIQGVLRLP